jgi:hypothetical protein
LGPLLRPNLRPYFFQQWPWHFEAFDSDDVNLCIKTSLRARLVSTSEPGSHKGLEVTLNRTFSNAATIEGKKISSVTIYFERRLRMQSSCCFCASEANAPSAAQAQASFENATDWHANWDMVQGRVCAVYNPNQIPR